MFIKNVTNVGLNLRISMEKKQEKVTQNIRFVP